jgi:hypothetical protein
LLRSSKSSNVNNIQPFYLLLIIAKKKTWVELTRRREHMKNSIGLNEDLLKTLI